MSKLSFKSITGIEPDKYIKDTAERFEEGVTMNIEERIKEILSRFITAYECYGVWRTITPDGKEIRNTSKEFSEVVDITIKELSPLLTQQKQVEDAVRGFVEAQGNYVFGKKILRERAEAYLKQEEDK